MTGSSEPWCEAAAVATSRGYVCRARNRNTPAAASVPEQQQEADLETPGSAGRDHAGMRADRRLFGRDARDQVGEAAEHKRRERLGK